MTLRATADWVQIADGRIIACGDGEAPKDAIHVSGARLMPGFVDLQVNGYGTVDFATSSVADQVDGLAAMARAGTTACLPTICSAALGTYDRLLSTVEEVQAVAQARGGCAAVLGVHLEGPFLGGAPGAHVREHIRPVDVAWLDRLMTRHPIVRMVTLAPEADPGGHATRLLVERGVTVALGHSSASAPDASAHAAYGARVVTHLFNGMSGLHHRNPGVAAAALTDRRLTPTIIPDFIHVDPVMLTLALQTRPDLAVVTDAVAFEAGVCGDLVMEAHEGAAYLPDGTLAGSTLTMAGAVRNLLHLGESLDDAVARATRHPAALIGATDVGRLAPGVRADIVAWSQSTDEVAAVWSAGLRIA